MSRGWSPTVLREYALIADGERGIVIGPHGEMVWLCFPRWDSAAVFASLIGGGGGRAHVTADTTLHTFKVSDTTSAAILKWYAGHLPQWTMTRSPAVGGTATDLVGRWKRGSRRLQVSSAPAPSAHAVQYTLIGTTQGTALP
jgi:Trehalase-like, N-terminal